MGCRVRDKESEFSIKVLPARSLLPHIIKQITIKNISRSRGTSINLEVSLEDIVSRHPPHFTFSQLLLDLTRQNICVFGFLSGSLRLLCSYSKINRLHLSAKCSGESENRVIQSACSEAARERDNRMRKGERLTRMKEHEKQTDKEKRKR